MCENDPDPLFLERKSRQKELQISRLVLQWSSAMVPAFGARCASSCRARRSHLRFGRRWAFATGKHRPRRAAFCNRAGRVFGAGRASVPPLQRAHGAAVSVLMSNQASSHGSSRPLSARDTVMRSTISMFSTHSSSEADVSRTMGQRRSSIRKSSQFTNSSGPQGKNLRISGRLQSWSNNALRLSIIHHLTGYCKPYL